MGVDSSFGIYLEGYYILFTRDERSNGRFFAETGAWTVSGRVGIRHIGTVTVTRRSTADESSQTNAK